MATVRFSEGLRDRIRSKARDMFQPQMEAAEASFNKELLDGVYDKLMAPYLVHLNAIPSEFLRTASIMDVHVHRGSTAIRLNLGSARPVPARDLTVPGVGTFTAHYSVPDIYLDANNPEWEPLREEYTAWKQRRMNTVAKRDEFLGMVNKILEAHVTLAPALKTWPALWELLPEETKEKHKEIKERKRRDMSEELEDVDLGKLTAAVTVHKLRGR